MEYPQSTIKLYSTYIWKYSQSILWDTSKYPQFFLVYILLFLNLYRFITVRLHNIISWGQSVLTHQKSDGNRNNKHDLVWSAVRKTKDTQFTWYYLLKYLSVSASCKNFTPWIEGGALIWMWCSTFLWDICKHLPGKLFVLPVFAFFFNFFYCFCSLLGPGWPSTWSWHKPWPKLW